MKFKRAESNVPDPDMTPMIDIVFQLIAFFMIVTNFEQTQADERVVLPADDLARPPLAPREDEWVINVGFIRDKAGNELGGPVIFYPGEEPIPVLQFGPKLELQRAVIESNGDDPKKTTLVIRADQEVPTGEIQELIKLSQEYGFQLFGLKAQVGEDEQ